MPWLAWAMVVPVAHPVVPTAVVRTAAPAVVVTAAGV